MMTQKEFHLETALGRIREIQNQLQEGKLSFEDSVQVFEEATVLITQCRTYLTESEVKLQKLSERQP